MVRKFGSNAWTGIVNGITVAFAAWILYTMWIHQVWDFLLAVACVAAPVLIVIGVISYLRTKRWERQSQ